MTSRKHARIGLTLAVAAVLTTALGGCNVQETGKNVGDFFANLFRDEKPDLWRQSIDQNDPAGQRRAIREMSTHRWGQVEPYLKAYATFAKMDTDELVRAEAISALGRARSEAYAHVIIAGLSDPSPKVRLAAAKVLEDLPDPNAAQPLAEAAMSDESADVRATSAWALRHYEQPAVVRALVQCLDDNEFAVRYQAHRSLVLLSGQDLGYEKWDWRVASSGELPERPVRRNAWWDPLDWWGDDEPDVDMHDDEVAAWRPKGAPSDSPWWDPMGMTAARDAPPLDPNAVESPQPKKSNHPWWDFLKIIDSSPQTPEEHDEQWRELDR